MRTYYFFIMDISMSYRSHAKGELNAKQCLDWIRKSYIDPLTGKDILISGDRYYEIERYCSRYINFDLLGQTDIEEFQYPESTPILSFLSLVYFLKQGKFCHPFKTLYTADTKYGDPFIDNFDFSFRWVQYEHKKDTVWQLIPPSNFKGAIEGCPESQRFVGIFITIISLTHVTANLLLYDQKDEEWERFVPFGATQDKYNQGKLDRALATYIRDQKMKVKTYYTPYTECPLDDTLDNEITPTIRNIYCAVWNLWFLQLKLEYPDEWQEHLIDRARSLLNTDIEPFNKFVTDYLEYLRKEQSKILLTLPKYAGTPDVISAFAPRSDNHQIDDILADQILGRLNL